MNNQEAMDSKIDGLELAGKVFDAKGAYSTYYNANYEKNGAPKNYNLEEIFADPQDNIKNILSLSNYYYNKYGIIMRVVNIIRDFGSTGYTLNYPTTNEEIRKIIEKLNKKIGVEQVIRDVLFELAKNGNCVTYDRDGKRVDIYPMNKIDVSPLIVDNQPVLLYKHGVDMSAFENLGSGITPQMRRAMKSSYPKEVAKAISNNSEEVALDYKNTFYIKTNSSRYEKFGVPFILTAFDELAHKTLLKEAEKATASGIIDKILLVTVGDKDHSPKQKEIDFYADLFDSAKGSLKATVPYFLNVKWIEPSTDIFGKAKFEQVDMDILNALGISLTLIRGQGGGNYSEGFLSVTGLIKTIEGMREDIPEMMNRIYRKELIRNGKNPDDAPEFVLNPVEIDRTAKFEFLQWLFQSAGLPYEVLYEEAGYDYSHIKKTRENENEEEIQDVFKLRAQPFQGQGDGETTGDGGVGATNGGGAPTKSQNKRKSDKKQSNNNQPRASKVK